MKYDLIINSDSNVIKLHVCDCFRKYDFVTIGRKMKYKMFYHYIICSMYVKQHLHCWNTEYWWRL